MEYSPETISLVMPCLNRAGYIADAVNSVLSQDYKNVQLVVADGGSTDGTVDILRSYALKDARLVVVTEPDRGLYDGLNKAIRLTSGKLIGWINSDDLLASGALERVVATATRFPEADIVCGDAEVFADESEDSPAAIHQTFRSGVLSFEFLRKSGVFLNTCFIRRRVYEEVGFFRTDWRIVSDRDFLIRLVLQKYTIAHVGAVVYSYRVHASSLTMGSSLDENLRRYVESQELCLDWLKNTGLPPLARQYCRYHLASAVTSLVRSHFRTRSLSRATAALWLGFRMAPLELLYSLGAVIGGKLKTIFSPLH